jgi:hypothetical protein
MPGFLDTLFPYDPAVRGLLSVQRIQDLQRSSELRAGIGILGAGQRGQPIGQALATGALPELSKFPEQIGAAAGEAARLNEYQRQQQLERGRAQLMAENPAPANGSAAQIKQWAEGLLPHAIANSDFELMGHLTNTLNALAAGHTDNGYSLEHVMQKDATGKPTGHTIYAWIAKPGTQGPPMIPTGAEVPQPGDPNADLSRQALEANRIQGELDRQTKDYQQTTDQVQQILAVAQQAKSGDASAAFQLPDNFIRVSNPKGVVRSGTVQLYKEALPIYTRAQALKQSYLDNKTGLLTPATIDGIIQATRSVAAQDLKEWRRRYDRSLTLAKTAGLPPGFWPLTPPDPSDLGIPQEGPVSRRAKALLGTPR